MFNFAHCKAYCLKNKGNHLNIYKNYKKVNVFLPIYVKEPTDLLIMAFNLENNPFSGFIVHRFFIQNCLILLSEIKTCSKFAHSFMSNIF